MITDSEQDYIAAHAYLPEHVIDYVTSISGAEPFLMGNYLCYTKKNVLIFVGYPLGEGFEITKMDKVLVKAIKQFKPERISIITPEFMPKTIHCIEQSSDDYYRLDVDKIRFSQKTRNMVNRALKNITIGRSRHCGDEHREIIAEFLNTHTVSDDTRHIFERIPDYVSSAGSSLIMNARDYSGKLVAFDVAEFCSGNYAFYMFNFKSRTHYIPGSSDLLLHELIMTASEQGKSYINLGLGINSGIRFFKKKWGAAPFLHYEFRFYEMKQKTVMEMLLQGLR